MIGAKRPAAGSVLVHGDDISTLREPERARRIAFVPQDPIVPAGLSVEEYVGLGRSAHRGILRGPSAKDRAVVLEVLDRLAFTQFAHRDVATLSGGERQRVVVARALAQHTTVLVLDEPITGLDLRHQMEILDIVRREVDECDIAVLSILHDLTLVAQYSDDVTLLDEGRIRLQGPVGEVLASPELEDSFGVPLRVIEVEGSTLVVPLPAKGRP